MNQKVKIGILISVAIVLTVLGITLYQNYAKSRKIITKTDPGLNTEQQQQVNDRLQQAQQGLSDQSKSDKDKFNLYMQQGMAYYAQGDYVKAKASYVAAAELDPKNANVYSALYLTQLTMKDYEAAKASLEKGMAIKPDSPDFWINYVSLMKDKFNASQTQLREIYGNALDKTGKNINVVTSFASYLESVGDLQGARTYWQLAIGQYPDGAKQYQQEVDRLTALIGR